MTDQVTTKVCGKCKVEKSMLLFSKHRGWCKECVSVSDRERYKANPEKKLERACAWHKANPERSAELSSAWHKANPERSAESCLAYRKANREALAIKKRESIEKLSDTYVVSRLGIPTKDAPQELIELKRINLLIFREIRKQQQCQN